MAANWPITKDDVRKALGVGSAASSQLDDAELTAIAIASSNRVDGFTGRTDDPTAWQDESGNLPPEFRLAAMDLAATWWQQVHNGPRQATPGPPGTTDVAEGMRGISWPRRTRAMLAEYEALPGIA